MNKKIIYIILLTFLISSCGDTVGSIKRGLTGSKANSGDEFLIKKKNPLILPPDFENLPTPDEALKDQEEVSDFEKSLDIAMEGEADTSASTDAERSILRKIQSK